MVLTGISHGYIIRNEAWNRMFSKKKKDRKKSDEGLYLEMNLLLLL